MSVQLDEIHCFTMTKTKHTKRKYYSTEEEEEAIKRMGGGGEEEEEDGRGRDRRHGGPRRDMREPRR